MPELRLENSIVDDRYRIDRCLSRGSYAEIFLSADLVKKYDEVIVKALNTNLQGTPDPELEQTLVENFQNEAIALDKVCHPNIVRRLGHGTAADLEGTPFHYIVMEYMPGGDLLSLCRAKPLCLEDALFYFKQVASALSFAHSRHVIHRDVKPNNLLLSRDKKIVKIADFGVAKLAFDESEEITRVGTNIYAPPEHHPDVQTGETCLKLTPSADIYSMAKTIYTSMTGRAPHQYARRPISQLPEILLSQPWGHELLRILEKATATQVDDRYHTVDEFWSDFSRLETATGEDSDSEVTIVRSRPEAGEFRRLATTISEIKESPVVQPNFQAPVTTYQETEGGLPQQARIVVELSQPTSEQSSTNHRDVQPSESQPPSSKSVIQVEMTRPSYSVPPGPPQVYKPDNPITNQPSSQGAAQTAVTAGSRVTPAERVLKLLKEISWLKWIRRTSIVILFIFLFWLGLYTYHYFGATYKDGYITNALNVNLRAEPRGDILVWLPNGTRVRVLEIRGGWIKVKVLQWPGAPPQGAPDTGWVDSNYVKLE